VAMMAGGHRATTTVVYRLSDGARHHTNYSRFLSRYRWTVDELSTRLLSLLVNHLPLWCDEQGRRRMCLVLDETIVEKSSKRMYGVAWQRNTHGGWCRGSHILGHYWLMLGILLPVAGRTLCFPLGFRLYRQKKRCPRAEYRTPCQLAQELLASIAWPEDRAIVRTVIADAGFADGKLIRWCSQHGLMMIVRGRMDAQVHDLYVQQPSPLRGRPRKYGERIYLTAHAQDDRNFSKTVDLYQTHLQTRVASVVGLHRASGQPMCFVVLRCQGKPDSVVMSLDLTLTPREIAQLYALRFEIEMTFRELKQHFGLGHYQVRLPEAMLRHVHLSAVACALTQLLTACPLQTRRTAALTRALPTPWRRPQAPMSVHESQLRVRIACQLGGTFAPVNSGTPTASKPKGPSARADGGPQKRRTTA
jgi:hypothetical protein